MFNINHKEWANLIFGNADLGDPRRTERLVKMAGDMAANTGCSVAAACDNSASLEGAYRFVRNKNVLADSIAQAGFSNTDALVAESLLVLAIQDTSGLSYRHSVCDELGSSSSAKSDKKNPKGRTLFAHSTIMIDAKSEQVLGLANQHYFFREHKKEETKEQLQNRDIKEKESYKWQQNIEELSARMGSLNNVLDVCDREADIYEYFDFQIDHGNRFLVRAKDNRMLIEPKGKLHDLIPNMEIESFYKVHIPQKGGRKARDATIALSFKPITIKKPKRAEDVAALNLAPLFPLFNEFF